MHLSSTARSLGHNLNARDLFSVHATTRRVEECCDGELSAADGFMEELQGLKRRGRGGDCG